MIESPAMSPATTRRSPAIGWLRAWIQRTSGLSGICAASPGIFVGIGAVLRDAVQEVDDLPAATGMPASSSDH